MLDDAYQDRRHGPTIGRVDATPRRAADPHLPDPDRAVLSGHDAKYVVFFNPPAVPRQHCLADLALFIDRVHVRLPPASRDGCEWVDT